MACLPSAICHHHLSSLAGFRVSCNFRMCGVLQCCVLYGGANGAFDEIRVPQRQLQYAEAAAAACSGATFELLHPYLVDWN